MRNLQTELTDRTRHVENALQTHAGLQDTAMVVDDPPDVQTNSAIQGFMLNCRLREARETQRRASETASNTLR